MNGWLLLAVSIAGGLGAVLRWGIDALVSRRAPEGSMRGLFVVNVTGSFLLGVVAGACTGDVLAVLGVGLLGGYTTFSAVAAGSAVLVDRRDLRGALWRSGSMFAGCVIAAAAGLWLIDALR